MFDIQGEIERSAKEFSIVAARLGVPEAQDLREAIRKKFAIDGAGTLWENLANSESTQDPNAWEWISDFVEASPAILFFNLEDDPAMYRFANGYDFAKVISDCFAFEFYLTDQQTSYLLAFNHHDFLIGSGTAKSWVKALRSKGRGKK